MPRLVPLVAFLFLTAGSSARAESDDAAVADAFFARLSALCGQAFAGTVETSDPADAAFAGKPLVMHVRDCSEAEIRIPFHVGDDRSRTWVISRTPTGLRLKRDHRHEDGSKDVLTDYGGDTIGAGTAGRQLFPADTYSKALFIAEGRAASTANVWAVEVEPETRFVYELSRPDRLFRVRFDLTRRIPVPPAPWGSS